MSPEPPSAVNVKTDATVATAAVANHERRKNLFTVNPPPSHVLPLPDNPVPRQDLARSRTKGNRTTRLVLMRLVLDFDGTVTERDTLDLVLERFGDVGVYERAEAELEAGRMTLNGVIAAEFASVAAPLDEVVAYLLEHARFRPGFAELARARRPLIVSSGFHELIEPLLEREGVLDAVELRANRVAARPDGWIVRFRVAEECDECGEPCKRA